MSKERDIEILEYKISEIDRKVLEFDRHGVDEKKKEALLMKKLQYEDQLAEIINS